MLTDLEYRVWTQYLLSADDFGVMRLVAAKVQADNDALLARPARAVQRCLDRIATTKLWLRFEHQGQPYVCQWDWQRWQKIGYPRGTNNPKPPEDVIAECDPVTQRLFELHPGGKGRRRFANGSENVSETDPERPSNGSGNVSRTDPDYAREGGRETALAQANGSGERLSANGSGEEGATPEDLMADWNDLTLPPIPRCRELSQKRRKHAHARLIERPRGVWRDVFSRIAASKFCNGDNDRGWVATFDWVMEQPDVAVKVLEGKYDNRRPSGVTDKTRRNAASAELLLAALGRDE